MMTSFVSTLLLLQLLLISTTLTFEHQATNPKKKTTNDVADNGVDVVGNNAVAIDVDDAPSADNANRKTTSQESNVNANANANAHQSTPPKQSLGNRLEETILEHSADSGKTFRTLATLKSAHDVAWSSSDAFDIGTLRAAANRSELYVVRLAGRPVNGAGVRICEWWHDVRRAVVTVHADGASGAAYHVDAHVSRPVTEVPLSCADAALLPAASATRQPAVRVDFGRAERAPKVAEFRRAVAKQRAEAQDNRPWYIKYWYYIVPAVVLFLISSATGGGGGGGGGAAAAST